MLTYSRTLIEAKGTLFFAITTKRDSGCRYVAGLYDKGVRNFVMPSAADEIVRGEVAAWKDANVWYVKDVVKALQLIAAAHRDKFGSWCSCFRQTAMSWRRPRVSTRRLVCRSRCGR